MQDLFLHLPRPHSYNSAFQINLFKNVTNCLPTHFLSLAPFHLFNYEASGWLLSSQPSRGDNPGIMRGRWPGQEQEPGLVCQPPVCACYHLDPKQDSWGPTHQGEGVCSRHTHTLTRTWHLAGKQVHTNANEAREMLMRVP